MAQFVFTDKQKATLTAAGIDWATLIAKLGTFAPMLIQLLLVLLGKAPTPASALDAMADACPCPDGSDGCACCHAGQRHILLAALCCEDHCSEDPCDTEACCRQALYHLLKAVECCTVHCCAKA